MKASLQDDIAAATRLQGFWRGLKTLVDGFFQPTGPVETEFNPTPEQSKALAKIKSQPQRIALLNQYQADWKARGQRPGRWIEGTIGQKIEATTELGSAQSELRSLLAEINKTPEKDDAEKVDVAAETRALLAALGTLIKTHGSNFRPLQSFAKGGMFRNPWALVGEEGPELVRMPVGSKVFTNKETDRIIRQESVPAFASGGSVKSVEVQDNSEIEKLLKELIKKTEAQGKTINVPTTIVEPRTDPHTFAKSTLFELEAA